MRNLFLTIFLVPTLGLAVTAFQSTDAYKVNRSSKLARDTAMGTQLLNAGQKGVRGKWVYSDAASGTVGSHDLLDHEGLAVKLPANAVMTDCIMDVVTQPTSAGSTLSIGVNSEGDSFNIRPSVHKSLLSTGLKDCTLVDTAATSVKILSEKKLQIQISSEAATAGKLMVWVEYVLSE